MLKITGGTLKGRSVECLKTNDIRPTTARVRESLFNILGHRVQEARFLDLFGGSGAMGIEAISHGASFVMGMDLASEHLKLINKNIEKLGISKDAMQYIPCNAFEFKDFFKRKNLSPFNMVFCDPPFKLLGMETLLSGLVEAGVLTDDVIVIWEYPFRYQPQEIKGLSCYDTRRYGDCGVNFYRKEEEYPPS